MCRLEKPSLRMQENRRFAPVSAASMAREMSAAVLSKDFPVFIDTNLDTHLAVVVSADDTVADLKRKVMLEHPLCFPEIGKIHIQAIKVRRRSSLYHLSDAMLVRSAFGGLKGTWYLHVDANSTCLMKNHVESTDDVLRPEIVGALKESLVIEPGACNFPADIAGKRQSCVVSGSSVDECLQQQPEPATALVHHDGKLTLCDPLYRTPPASDDLHLPPQVASSDIENCQVPTEGQFGPINGYREAPELGAKDSNAEFVSSSDVSKRSDYEVLKIQNSVCDENIGLEVLAPLKGNISEKERGIGCNVSSLSFVPIKQDKSMNGSIDIQENTSVENLQAIPAAEKKRKREKKKENNAFTKTSENSLRSDATDAAGAKGASESENGNSKESSNKSWNDDCSAQKLNEEMRIQKSLEIHNDLDSESPDGSGLPVVPIPLPSGVHHSITSKETVAGIDVDPVVAIEMEDNNDCNVEMRNDLVETVIIGDKKAKRLKKHCINSVSLPLLVAEDSTSNMTPLHGNVTLADDTIGLQLTVENNNPTSSSALLDLSTSNSKAAGIMDSVSYIEKADSGKVENKRDTLREAMASGDKKAKKSRKHHMPSLKSPIPPLVEERDYSAGNITRLQQLAEVVESVTMNTVSVNDNIVGICQNVESSNPASLCVPQGASMLKTVVADTAMDSTVVINSNEVNGTEAETGRNASAQAVAAGDKKVRKLRKHRVASPRSLNPSSTEDHGRINEKTISLHENVTLGNGNTDIHQFNESVKEVNALSKNAKLKTMMLVANNLKNESLGLDEVESGKDAVDSVILPEASEIFETGDIKDRKRKKSKKTRIGGAKKHAEDAIPMNSDNGIITEDCGETKEVGDALSLQEPTEKLKTKNSNNQLPCPNEEADNVSREGPIPPNIPSLSEVSAELGSEKGRRKLKTILASTAIGGSEPLMDRHDVGTVELTPSSPECSAMDYLQKVDVNQSDQTHKEENTLPRKKKKERSRKMNSKDPLLESVSLGGKEANAREGDSQSDQSHREENALPRKKKKERSRKTISKDPLSGSVSLGDKEANAGDSESPVVGSLNEASDGKIDFKDAFVRGEKQRGVVDPTEDAAAKEAPKKLSKEKTIRHKIKPDALSKEMLGLESHTGSNGPAESRKKVQDVNANTVEIEGPLSKDKQGKHSLCSNGNFVVPSKRKKISRTSVSNTAGDGTSEQLFAGECAKENDAPGDTSSASTDLEGTVSFTRGHRHVSSPPNRYRVAVRKVPRRKVGEVLNNSEMDKSQLVTPDSIFKHLSSGSSQDDGEVHDSDATTISHSNDSASPAYSGGEHEGIHSKTLSHKKQLNLDSPASGHGALSMHRQKSAEDGSDGIVLSQATDVKSRSFGTVLRSSSAYRKAKISLSQSRLDDFESQPEDVVPDSQAANLS